MAEWIIWRKLERPDSLLIYNWRLTGEIELDLCLGWDPPRFELARFLKHPSLIRLIQDPHRKETALDSIQKNGRYIDVFWSGYSPEILEEYCRGHLLPLPESYRESFDRANQRYVGNF